MSAPASPRSENRKAKCEGASVSPLLSRREFLQTTGALIVGLSVAGGGAAQRLPAAEAALGKTLDLSEVDGFLAIVPTG
jgi:hypothetical protein